MRPTPIQGGSGADSAVVDLADTVVDVEKVDRPRARVASIARQGHGRVRNGRLVAIFAVSCPAGAESQLPPACCG